MANTTIQKTSTAANAITILLLVVAYPIGVIVMWFATKWSKVVKIILTVLTIIWLPIGGLVYSSLLIGGLNQVGHIQQAQRNQCVQQCGKNAQNTTCINTCMSKYSNSGTNTSAPSTAPTQ